MTQLVLKTELKQVDGDIEQILDKSESIDEVEKSIEVKELTMFKGSTVTFSGSGQGAIKGIRIVSDYLFKISSTSEATTTEIPFVFRDITLFRGQILTNGTTTVVNSALGYHGSVTVTAVGDQPGYEPPDNIKVKIIFYY